jgi:DNA-binding NarL/FixJ family response regulator
MGEGPSPLEAAVYSDFTERLMAALPKTDREICKLLMQGYTLREISDEMKLCLSVVHKHVSGRIRREAVRMGAKEAAL